MEIELSITRSRTDCDGAVSYESIDPHTIYLPSFGDHKKARCAYTGWCDHDSSQSITCSICPPHTFKIWVTRQDNGSLSISMESRFVHDNRATAIGEFIDHRNHTIAMTLDDIKHHEALIQELLQELATTIDPEDGSYDGALIERIAESKGVIARHNAEIVRLQSISTIPFTKTVRKTTTNTVQEGEFSNFIACVTSSRDVTSATYAVMVRRKVAIMEHLTSPVVDETSALTCKVPKWV